MSDEIAELTDKVKVALLKRMLETLGDSQGAGRALTYAKVYATLAGVPVPVEDDEAPVSKPNLRFM